MNIPLSRARQRFDALRATRTLLVGLCAFATMRGANAATFSNYENAKLVIGQADFASSSGSPTQITTPGANDSAISSLGVLAVCQQGGRVFLYNTVPTTNGAPADVIVGKPDFTSYAQGTPNQADPQNPIPTADLLRNSTGVAFSPDGTKLLVADFTNNRVLIWNSIPTTNGAPADVVIGQTDFSSRAFGCSATLLSEPVGVMVTPGGKVLISDFGNRRVVVYNSIPTTNGAAADYVIGQTNLTSFTSSTAANGLQGPWHTAVSPDGKLLIADATSNSVRIFNTIPTASNASANVIIGQTTFGYPAPDVNQTPTPTASTLNQPIGVSVSATGQVAIGEFRNNRTLIYNSVPTTNGAAADVVLGQPDFATRDYHDPTNTTPSTPATQNGLSRTYGVNFIPDGRLLVSDIDNNREMVFGDTTPTITAATITPLAPKTNDIVTVHPIASDADGDTLTYSFQWYKNNNPLMDETGPKLNLSTPGNGDKGDAITCVVTVSDSTGNSSTPRTSDEVIVQNSAPVVTSATINHKHPLTYDTLTANAKTTDADGDLRTLSYQWNKNGSPIAGQTNSTLDLSQSGNGDDGDVITVTITANDGTADSAPVTSDSVTIGNIQPHIVLLWPLNAFNNVGDKRVFILQVKDDNEVSDISEMSILINTSLDVNNGAYLLYDKIHDLLYLRQGDNFLPPIHIGAAAGPNDILDNGAVRIIGSEVTTIVTGSNTTFKLSIPAIIRNGLVGKNTLFGRVVDVKGTGDPAALPNDMGFVRFDPYLVKPQFAGNQNNAPTLSDLTPKVTNTTLNAQNIAPNPQSIGFFFKDEDGAGDIDSVWFLAGKQRGWKNSATFVYYPRDRRLFLRSDDGNSFIGGGQIGTTGILENSQVKVDLSKVKVLIYNDGKSLGLSLPLQGKTGLLGHNNIWLRVQDTKGAVVAGSDDQGYVLSGGWDIKKQEGADAPPATPSAPSS